jgi:16S rRNA (guanine966-N2)-methyltransferase
MGAEALCRGAATVVGIEQSAAACRLIQANWQKVAHAEQTFEIFRGDVVKQVRRFRDQSFDLIYFDPPYASGLYVPVLTTLITQNCLSTAAEIAVEHDPEQWTAVAPTGLRILREKRYGSTHLTFFELDQHTS